MWADESLGMRPDAPKHLPGSVVSTMIMVAMKPAFLRPLYIDSLIRLLLFRGESLGTGLMDGKWLYTGHLAQDY